MEQLLICLSVALIAGLFMSRLAKAIHLPAVTSYLLAGLLLGPFFLGRLGLSNLGIGFGGVTNLPFPKGDAIVVGGYRIARKIFKFN